MKTYVIMRLIYHAKLIQLSYLDENKIKLFLHTFPIVSGSCDNRT